MKRSTLILGGLFLLLVVIALLLMQKPGEVSTTEIEGSPLLEVDSLSVDKIEISSPSLKVVLEKKGVEWHIQHPVIYRADQANVGTLIQQLKNLRAKATVSSNPEKQSVFQVDSTGVWVTLFEKGAEKAKLIVGKMGPTFSETYVRLANSNEVHLAEGIYTYTLNRAVKEWRDRTIASVPRENIKEITYQYGDTTFAIVLRDSVWMIGKEKANESEVNSLLSTLSNLTADDFVDIPPNPSPRFRTSVSYGGVQLLLAEVRDQNKYFVRTSTTSQWFEIQPWRANQILKRRKDFLK
ncbi:MAG TPA: DUF4340 domain-containing protein [Bacteroidota bacterium]|nr:DUF4340 domain-containing protein [Bacteroidota bacterium]